MSVAATPINMWKKWSIGVTLALLSALLIHGNALAQFDRGIRVSPTIAGPVSIMPGEIATAGIRISSSSDSTIRCLSFVDLPEGWRMVIGESGFDVAPGKEETRLVSVAVPGNSSSGPYAMSYILRLADTGEEIHRANLTVNVRSKLGLDIMVKSSPKNAVAGLQYSAAFQVTNNSNEHEKIRFRFRSVPDLPTVVESDSLILMPFESRDIHVTVHTDDSRPTMFQHALEMHAWLDADSTIAGKATALVQVLPRTTIVGEKTTIPFLFTFRNTGENGNNGSQVELFSTGSFSGGNPNHYELLLRGPDNRTQSLLGRRDEYRIAYETMGNEVIVGDQAFRLTPLTELGRYAFGASAKGRMDRWQAGAFVNESRWSPAKANEAAAFASFDATTDISVGVNYLHKEELKTSDILTVQGEFGILNEADIAMELGGSQSPGEKGKGIGFELRSRPSWIQYGANLIYAEPGFGGYYRDFDAKALNFAVFPVDQLRFEGYYRNEKRGLDKDPALLHAPQNEEVQAGVGYGSWVATYLKLVRYRDLLPNPKYDRQERTVVLHIGATFQTGSVFATVDVGRTEELLLNRSYPLRRISLSSRFQPSPFQGYSVSLEYGSTKDLFTDLSREGTSWSLSAWYRLTSSLQIQASVYQSWTIAPFRQMNTLGDATVEYTFPFGHRLSVMGRINSISSSFEADNTAYSVEYAVPFDISFSSTAAGGRLKGRIVDLESGLGLSDVVLYAGDQVAISDYKGSFEFPNLRVGTYAITLDRSVIGPERIPSDVLPSDLEIVEGLERTLEIGIVQSCAITGEVIGYRERPTIGIDGSARTSHRLSSVMVEIKSGKEVFRRVTDQQGRFSFRDLRPGTWSVAVLADDLPQELRSSGSAQFLTLKPGQTMESKLELVPPQRRIRMLQEGTLLKMR